MNHKSNGGFTLIEMLIVVAIIGILASIAYPSYRDSILKGRRAEGRKALTELLQQQERFMTQTNTYCAFSNASGTATVVAGCTTVPFKIFSSDSLAGSAYLMSAEACPDGGSGTMPLRDCIRVVATPTQADAAAGSLRMTSSGTRDCTVVGSTVCWR